MHKFDPHLPLYRQAEIMAAPKGSGGIDIDRSTLAGWAGQAAHLLDPIVSRIREEGLKADKIHASPCWFRARGRPHRPGSGPTSSMIAPPVRGP